MAIKYECDRCHIQTDEKDIIAEVSYPILNYHKNEITGHQTKDLCIKCILTLHEFLSPPSKP